MSINIDQPGFPDTGILEQLANQLFKATTIEEQVAAEKDLLHYNNTSPYTGVANQFTIPLSVPGRYPALPSAGGVGASAGVIPAVNTIDLRNAQLFAPAAVDHSISANTGTVVGGNGISPSAHQQGNAVDLNNPQTALHDPHFARGQAPASLAGDGRSPSVPYTKQQGHPSAFYNTDFFPDLSSIVNQISSFTPEAQLPGLSAPLNEETYYFLDRKGHPLHTPLPAVKSIPATSHRIAPVEPSFDLNLVKQDFPILQETVNGKPLIWLDNAATTQKPKVVIDRVSYFYEHENSNIHRAAHELAARATDAYEGAREKVRRFLNAASINEIVFVRGTTEAINLVANTFGEQYLQAGDEIIVSHLEHHANIVPWQQLASKKRLKLKVIPVDDHGQLLLDEYRKLLTPKVKLVSFTQVSNALGTVTPAKEVIDLAHANGAKVLLDGAQSVSHMRVDLQLLNPDFFVFSGHKIFGPTGIGVVYGKEELLNSLQPWQGGGNMIKDVTFEYTQFHNAPARFEAGTGNIADAVGLGAALDYVTKLGIDNISLYEHYLLEYATQLMQQVPGLRLIGTAREKASVLSFTLKGYSNDEVGKALNREGIAVRTGHHCAQPILRRFGVESTVRPSLAFYNTCSDIDSLVQVLQQLKK